MPRKRVVADGEAATFDAIASGTHWSQASTPVAPGLVANLERLVRTTKEPSSPWEMDSFVWAVVWGDQSGAPLPMVPEAPSGDRARELREAAGLSLPRLNKTLRLPGGIIPEVEAGTRRLVPEILDYGYGIKGVLRLYGCLQCWNEQLKSKFVTEEKDDETE